MTLLSALMVAACGNGEKKATETTAAPTTEVTTAAPTTTAPTTTTSASSETAEVSLEDTQRIGREDTGYVNVPKDWVEFKAANGGPQYQYAALDGYNIVTLNGYTKDKYQPGEGETWGAEMVANRLFGSYKKNPSIEKIQGAKRKSGWNGCFSNSNPYKRRQVLLHLGLPKERQSVFSKLEK